MTSVGEGLKRGVSHRYPQVRECFHDWPSSTLSMLPGQGNATEEDKASGGDGSLYYHATEAVLSIK